MVPHIDVAARPICYKVSIIRLQMRDAPCPTWKTCRTGRWREAITKTPVGRDILNYRIVSTPVRDELGRIVAAIEMVEDITESSGCRSGSMNPRPSIALSLKRLPPLPCHRGDTTIPSSIRVREAVGSSGEEIEGRRSWTEFVALGRPGRMLEYHRLRRLDPNAPPRNYEFQHLDRSGQARKPHHRHHAAGNHPKRRLDPRQSPTRSG